MFVECELVDICEDLAPDACIAASATCELEAECEEIDICAGLDEAACAADAACQIDIDEDTGAVEGCEEIEVASACESLDEAACAANDACEIVTECVDEGVVIN